MLRIVPQRTAQCIEQRGGRVWYKADPIARSGISIHIGHRIGQATGRMDDGQRAVAQCDQLPQAPWLEGARHQKEIRARVDAVGESYVEADARTYVACACGKLAEQLLVARMPGAQHHKLKR
ncbi:MAG TPA: hypothetical protein VJQ26_13135 [Ktedonobacteraceae bacterium]|nr:hypothetical protein [Ktedonobacteraceae bacterium]